MDQLFGSRLRTETLIGIARLGQTYASELARLLGRRTVEIQRAVASLEKSGAIVSRRLGTTRILQLNPRYQAREELYALLLKLSENPALERRWAVRRRPRAIGKAL